MRQYLGGFSGSHPTHRKGINFFNYPAGILSNQQMAFFLRVLAAANGHIGENPLSFGKFGLER